MAVLDLQDSFMNAMYGSVHHVRPWLANEWCLDAMAYQILGRAHLARLGSLPIGARPLGDDRFELSVGDPADWLPTSPIRPAIQRRTEQILAPCLIEGYEEYNRSFCNGIRRATFGETR